MLYASRLKELRMLAEELMSPIKGVYEKTNNEINYVKANLQQRWNSMDDVRKRLVKSGVAYSTLGVIGHCMAIYFFGIPGSPPLDLNSIRAGGQISGQLFSAGLDYVGIFHTLAGIKIKNQNLPPFAELPNPQTTMGDYF